MARLARPLIKHYSSTTSTPATATTTVGPTASAQVNTETFSPVSLLRTPPSYSPLHPISSIRSLLAYRREKSAASGILLRHFRQADIVRPTTAINHEYIDALLALGFPRAKLDQLRPLYCFETVEAVLTFLSRRSNQQNLYNLTSLLGLFVGAFITWYYSDQAMRREELKKHEEEQQQREIERRKHQNEQWESLFDVKQTALDEPGFQRTSATIEDCDDDRAVVSDILDVVYCHHQNHRLLGNSDPQRPSINPSITNQLTGTEGVDALDDDDDDDDDFRHNDDRETIDNGALSRGGVYESAFVNIVVGPPGSGKSEIIKKIFQDHLTGFLTRQKQRHASAASTAESSSGTTLPTEPVASESDIPEIHAAVSSPAPTDGRWTDQHNNIVLFYIDFKDAFKVNTMDHDFVTAKFFDFLDDIQHRALVYNENITLFIDTADYLADVFQSQQYAQVIRHVHETGRFANVFLIYNSYANYEKLKQYNNVATQHRLFTVPFITNRTALLDFVRRLRQNVTESTSIIAPAVPTTTTSTTPSASSSFAESLRDRLAQGLRYTDHFSAPPSSPRKWDLDDDQLVDALGGQFNDYMKIKRTVLAGRQSAKDVLAQLLMDSHERVENALGVYANELDRLHCYYYHLARAILEGRTPPIPYALRRTFMSQGLFFDAAGSDQLTMSFFFPRDRAVFYKMTQDQIYRRHFSKLQMASKALTMDTSQAAGKLVDWFQLRKDEHSQPWWRRALGRLAGAPLQD
ncbi:hypothetical protein RI367_007205 [Sorochytrium milnesiophthora]